MAKKRKPESDVNVTAFQVLQAVTGEPADLSHNETQAEEPSKKKDVVIKDVSKTEKVKLETDMRNVWISWRIPFVFEDDKRLVEELAIHNSYIRGLFKL